jgi:ATP-dependent Zn protease
MAHDITLFAVCLPAGYTLFVEDEAARANALLSRGDMEGVMVVHLAGRAAEKMVMGEAEVRGALLAGRGSGLVRWVFVNDVA